MRKIAARKYAIGAFIPVVVMLSIVFALGSVSSMAFAEDDNTPEAGDTEGAGETPEAGDTEGADGADGAGDTGMRGNASKGQSTDWTPDDGQCYEFEDENAAFDGDINSINTSEFDAALGVAATSGETEVTVKGNVTDTDDNEACGVSASASGNNSTAKVDVSGNVTATGGSDTYGIKASPKNGASADITVGGSVNATSGNGKSAGIWVNADENAGGGNVTHITVNESVTATGRGAVAGIKRTGSSQDYAYITVAGDVTAVGSPDGVIQDGAVRAGVNISGRYLKLVVGGTVSGESGIVTSDTFVTEYNETSNSPFTPNGPWSSIAVWQIKANDNSKPVAYVPGNDNTIKEDETKALLGMIDYIIKYGDGQEEFFTLSADRNLGSVKVGGSDYQTAKSGTVLTLVADRAGYTLKQVFGLDGGTALTRNADGSYTLVVPDGGGILLRADWKQEPKKDNNTPEDNDNKDNNTPEDNDETATATPAKAKPTGIVTTSTNVANATTSVQANDGLPATSDPMSAPVIALVLVATLAGIFAAKSARKTRKQ